MFSLPSDWTMIRTRDEQSKRNVGRKGGGGGRERERELSVVHPPTLSHMFSWTSTSPSLWNPSSYSFLSCSHPHLYLAYISRKKKKKSKFNHPTLVCRRLFLQQMLSSFEYFSEGMEVVTRFAIDNFDSEPDQIIWTSVKEKKKKKTKFLPFVLLQRKKFGQKALCREKSYILAWVFFFWLSTLYLFL